MTMKELIDGPHAHWFAAAAGALVGLKALPGSSITEKLSNVAAGFAIAAWSGPAIVDHLAISKPSIAAGVVFGVGACGLVLFHSLIAAIRTTDFAAWLAQFMPPRRKGD